jgi:putative two-component system response regulator
METKKSILVIDDEPDAIEFVRAVLSNLGKFIIIAAKDGEEGIELVKKHLPDLIILDIMMPGQSGFDVFYSLRNDKLTKDIPVVMLTGVADKAGLRFFKDDMKKYFGSEPVEYIEKPLDPSVLLSTVKKVFKI